MAQLKIFAFILLCASSLYSQGMGTGFRGRGSGTGTDSDAFHVSVSGEIAGIANKGTPVNGDYLLLEDSEDGNSKKYINWSQLPGSGGGQANTLGDMPGTGVGLAGTKSGDELRVNRIYSSGFLTVSDSTDSVHVFAFYAGLSDSLIDKINTLSLSKNVLLDGSTVSQPFGVGSGNEFHVTANGDARIRFANIGGVDNPNGAIGALVVRNQGANPGLVVQTNSGASVLSTSDAGVTTFGGNIDIGSNELVYGTGSLSNTDLELLDDGSISLTGEIAGVLSIGNGGTGVGFADPDADYIMFWDDSAGRMAWLIPSGSQFSISADTTLTISSVSGVTGANEDDLSDNTTDDLPEGASNLYNQTHTGEVTGAIGLTIDRTTVFDWTGQHRWVGSVNDTIIFDETGFSQTNTQAVGEWVFGIFDNGTFVAGIDSLGNLDIENDNGTGNYARVGSPALTTPIIGDFQNATHSHKNAGGGGTLKSAALDSNGVDGVRTNAQMFAQKPISMFTIDIPDSLESDTLIVYSNFTGATVTIDSVRAFTSNDDYDVILTKTDLNGGNAARVDSFRVTTNGVNRFYHVETTFDSNTLTAGQTLCLEKPKDDGDWLTLAIFGNW